MMKMSGGHPKKKRYRQGLINGEFDNYPKEQNIIHVDRYNQYLIKDISFLMFFIYAMIARTFWPTQLLSQNVKYLIV